MKFQESWKAHVNTAFYFDCCIFIFCQKYLRIDQKFTEPKITRKTESKCWLGCDFAFKFIYKFAIVRLKVWPNQIGRKKGSLVRMKKSIPRMNLLLFIDTPFGCHCIWNSNFTISNWNYSITVSNPIVRNEMNNIVVIKQIWILPLAWISDFISDFGIVQSNAIEWKL